jgi:hypothetical protein
MITVCTCSHSIDAHGVCGGRCETCICPCFRGARRIPKSCRYRLRTERERAELFAPPPSPFGIPLGGGLTRELSAAELGLFEEQEKAS